MSKKINRGAVWIWSLVAVFFGILLVSSNTTDVKAQTVNDYITQNRIEPVAIQYREGTFSHWIPYENGVGKPEGVVVHETADYNATAENEVTYFNREWPNMQSYVHAFVDNNEIINIHSADYGVWGAGPTANAKYIQVEVCEEHTQDAFARAITNDAYYVAAKLIQYGLPDIPGQTVVSHAQVSKMYGETTHTDPDGYFASMGYNMDQFNDLVGTFYNNLKNYGSVYNNGGSSTNAGSNNNTSSANVINVNNANGDYVPIMALKSDGTFARVTNRALKNNTPWQTDKTQESDGVTYRRVATNEWVASTYVI
ncbi:peptidoglycan recognition protein family protein [Companilactobacillus jidongensis]|uniref:peptidoglycan recognition protein family protein n=1 Tax=Companilactobacillus jidongensis TaxID=2486006 RepID=UPI000F785206|nr:peptidoglycan recognition family protein [Companilactobacillus jidongensis]